MELEGEVPAEPLTVQKGNQSPAGYQHLLFFQVEILLWFSVSVGISYTLPLLLKKTHLKFRYGKIPTFTWGQSYRQISREEHGLCPKIHSEVIHRCLGRRQHHIQLMKNMSLSACDPRGRICTRKRSKLTEPWPRLPREAVESPSLEIFQTRLAAVLCSLLWVTLLRQGVGLGDPQRSLPTPAMLGFCETSDVKSTIF